MCVRKTSVLNPCAQEWRPAPPYQVILTPHPPPPQTAVQAVALPPQLLPYSNPPYFFIPYGPRTPPYHSTPFSFPAAGRFLEAPPPCFGGAEEKIMGGSGKPIVMKSWKASPRMWKSTQVRCYYSVDEKARARRREWRRRKADSDDAVAGGGATLSPPCNSASNLLPAAPRREEISPSTTTVMIKNIPNQLRRDFMLEFLDGYCNEHTLEYDFFYLPMDFRKKDNLGYAFVNFTTAAAASKFKRILQNYQWDTMKTDKGTFTSKKICDITWARIQGKEGLIKRFENSKFACDKLDFLPVVLDPPRNGSNTKLAAPIILGRLNQQNKIF